MGAFEAAPNNATAANVKAAMEETFRQFGVEVEEPKPTPPAPQASPYEVLQKEITAISARDFADWDNEAADQREDRVVLVKFQREAQRFIILIRPHANADRGRKVQVNR